MATDPDPLDRVAWRAAWDTVGQRAQDAAARARRRGQDPARGLRQLRLPISAEEPAEDKR